MKFKVKTEMYCAPESVVDIPVKSWDEVRGWFVKWDVLNYTLDDVTWHEVPLNSNVECIDWKRPAATTILNPDTDETIAE